MGRIRGVLAVATAFVLLVGIAAAAWLHSVDTPAAAPDVPPSAPVVVARVERPGPTAVETPRLQVDEVTAPDAVVPSSTTAPHPRRVTSAASRTPVTTARPKVTEPARPAAPGASPPSYAFTSSDPAGRHARWDPCTAIRWAFNPAQAPAGALELATAAIDRLTAASGLRFSYVGTTDYLPLVEKAPAPPAGIDAVIAFAGAAEFPDFVGATFGTGGFTSSTGADGPRIVRGGVVLNTSMIVRIPDGFGPGQRRGGALLHELGHMVGLDHVEDPSQLMHPALTPSAPEDYAAGDRAGLAAVGAPVGCFVLAATVNAAVSSVTE